MMYSNSNQTATLASNKAFLYAPLEQNSEFSKGEFLGGIGMVQIIRYAESLVGPYDEMLIAPGFFKYEVEGKDGAVQVKKNNARITRIYVSQKETCFNGRTRKYFP
jgi:hypothetical protein